MKIRFINFLLSVDENLIQSLTENGFNIIELAARYCNIEIFNFLKEKFIESKPKSYKEGELIATQSASRIVCLSLLNNENFNICQYLIPHLFATRKLFCDDPNYSPLRYAISSENLTLEKIKFLMNYGLNLETELLKEYAVISSYPIHLSLSSKNLNVIKYFFNYLFQIKNGDLSKILDIFNKSNVLTESKDIDQLLFFHKEFHSEIIKKLNESLKIEFDSKILLTPDEITNKELPYLQSIFFRVIYSIKYDINSIEYYEDYDSTDPVEKNTEAEAKKILACKITKIINDKNIDDSEETSNEAIANKIANFITENDLHYLEEVGDNLGIKIIESPQDDIEEKVVIIPKEISAILREKYQIIKPSATQESVLLTVDLEVDQEPSTSPKSLQKTEESQLGKRNHDQMQEQTPQ